MIGVGDVRTSKDAAGLLEHADFVAVGRALLIDPHWGQKVLDGPTGRKGLDYLHISLADYTRKSISKAYQEKSMLAYVYEKIAQRVPLIGVGDVRTSKDAAGLLEHADFVAVGRALLIDPHWGQKVLDGQDELIRTTVSPYEREELVLQNGVWGFMENMMPDRLNEEK